MRIAWVERYHYVPCLHIVTHIPKLLAPTHPSRAGATPQILAPRVHTVCAIKTSVLTTLHIQRANGVLYVQPQIAAIVETPHEMVCRYSHNLIFFFMQPTSSTATMGAQNHPIALRNFFILPIGYSVNALIIISLPFSRIGIKFIPLFRPLSRVEDAGKVVPLLFLFVFIVASYNFFLPTTPKGTYFYLPYNKPLSPHTLRKTPPLPSYKFLGHAAPSAGLTPATKRHIQRHGAKPTPRLNLHNPLPLPPSPYRFPFARLCVLQSISQFSGAVLPPLLHGVT